MKSVAPPPGIAAKFAFTCPRCDNLGHPGERVAYQRGEYVHVRCCPGGDDES